MIILDHENQMLYFHKRKPDLKMGNLTVCGVQNSRVYLDPKFLYCWAYFYF